MMDYLKNPGIQFILKFIVLFFFFFYFNNLFIGLTAPGGSAYFPFVEKHLNYIAWLRSLLLHGANILSHLIGLNTDILPPYLLRLSTGSGVKMVYSCIGFGVLSFWAAFVLANEGTWKKKLLWVFAGLFGICFINCWRITFLLLTLKNKGNINKFAEHHTVFNIAAYTLIFIMMYFYARRSKEKQEEGKI